MASLTGKNITATYKDLLTILGETNNQGLENTSKRVFDGDGIGSPLYLGTSTLDVVGTSTFTGNTTFTGLLTVSASGVDSLIIDTANSEIKKGDGTKGKINLGDTDITLKKGNTEILKVKEDGTLRLRNVSSLPSSPSSGDMVNYNGTLYINTT